MSLSRCLNNFKVSTYLMQRNENYELSMEEEIKELEQRHVELYLKMLEALDKLYLLRKGVKPVDESLLVIRHQLQTSLTMTIPTIKAISNTESSNELDTRLSELMTENFELDQQVVSLKDKRLRLIKELTSLRKQHKQMLPQTQELVETIRLNNLEAQSPSPLPQKSDLQQEEVLQSENEKLTELITALIIHCGYQGTSPTIDEWLEYL